MPEWKDMADWSGLPDVYVTKAEYSQGMFWRIEACSVPMAVGPEVRLIRADEVQRLIAEAVAREREACAAMIDMSDEPDLGQYTGEARFVAMALVQAAAAIRNRKETT